MTHRCHLIRGNLVSTNLRNRRCQIVVLPAGGRGITAAPMFCNSCGDPIEDGGIYVDRVVDPEDKDGMTLAWLCPTCDEPGVGDEPRQEMAIRGQRRE